jgi:hypothetical protein
MIPLMRTYMFILGIFNIPAILALVACTFESKLVNYRAQKTVKMLLKVGIAKAVGGILLAIYIGLKYAVMINDMNNHSSRAVMKSCAIYLGGSALVDILYSLLAFMVIEKTKSIIKILRRERSKRRNSVKYSRRSSSEESSPSSVSSVEEENSERESQNNI